MINRFFKLSTLLCAIFIAVLSLQTPSGQAGIAHADKVLHVIAYGTLASLAAFGWPKTRLLHVVIIIVLFGISLEFAQAIFASGRTASLLDALANLLGASLAAWLIKLWRSA